jgi:hypothetical protein
MAIIKHYPSPKTSPPSQEAPVSIASAVKDLSQLSTNVKSCKGCSKDFFPRAKNQKFCEYCRPKPARKSKKNLQGLHSMSSQETTAIGPVVDAALELVRRCTELGISHAVQLNISGTKLTIERG